jgi:DNA segregation ATPase FtsK/SpoIIIE, S-DNA-T family
VATQRSTQRSRQGSRKGSGGGAGRSKKSGARGSRPARSSRASSPKPFSQSLTGRALRAGGEVLYRYADDVGGVLLTALGAVVGLGVYAGAGGTGGRALADAVSTLVGWQRLAVPPVLVVIGVALVWWRRDPSAATEDDSGTASDAGPAQGPSTLAHAVVGALLITTATAGLLHIWRGLPSMSGPVEPLRDAGGWLGAMAGGPLHDLLSTVGSSLVLTALGVAGLVVLTRTPIRVAADRTMAGVRPLTSTVGSHLMALLGLTGGPLSPRTEDDQPGGPGLPEPTLDTGPDDDTIEQELPVDGDPVAASDGGRTASRSRRRAADVGITDSADADGAESEQLEIDLGPATKASPWKLPPLSALERSGSQQIDRRMLDETGRTLERTLAEHGVETRLVGIVAGPTVSRYELELAPGVKVNRVTSLNRDIGYAMATPDVRILAPIPGKQAIGIEVPNARRHVITLGDILSSDEARRATHPLDVAVGRDFNGRSVTMNLAAMPHLLIAGATGAGKSSCLNALVTSILMRSTPEQVRMILIDPKRVEMGQYDRLPHLLTSVVTNPKKAANALAWAVKEMEHRYDLLAELGFRDITGYNAAVMRGDVPPETNAAGETVREFSRLPYILVVIDELSDLMMVAARDVEDSVCRLAQMARAVGIHLVIATQRPSVNVITGLIKANVPARLAFAVSSATDSRVILDQAGAERLIGKGDMLLLEGGSSVPRRLQGAWVGEPEVRDIVSAWKRQAPDVSFDEDVQGSEEAADGSRTGADDDDDDMLNQAMELVVRSQLGSTSMLQRKLRVGFARAGRLMDLLEQRGVVGPSEGSKARAVLMTVDELEEILGTDRD